MLDFPRFTKETFPGVTHMDLFSGLFGDVTDDSMYVSVPLTVGAATRVTQEFDPSSASGKRWLDTMANQMAKTGTTCQHISNNAPRDICEPDEARRKTGIEVAKKWLDGATILGAKSMRVNSGGPRIAPPAVATADYPKADELAGYLTRCIESFKEMADHGSKVGVKVTLENHWGLTANPIHIRIIVDEVNNPFCEASPDFCNWEHEYLMYHGLKALAPYAHTNVHAKYLESLEGQQRGAIGEDHARRGLRRHLRAGIRRRTMGRHRGLQVPLQGSAGGAVAHAATPFLLITSIKISVLRQSFGCHNLSK